MAVKWSYSAHNTMRRCQRQLAFGQVVASHNAKNEMRHEAHILKQLKSLSTWQGLLVHQVLATDFLAMVRSGTPLNAARLSSQAQDLARRQFAFSEARLYRAPNQTKTAAGATYCALAAHEHGREIKVEELARIDTNLATCFKHLAAEEEFLANIYAGSGHQAEVGLRFKLNEIAVEAWLDLVFTAANGQLTVVDWKVEESGASTHLRQLLIYALAVERSGRWLGIRAEDVALCEVNLLRGHVRQYQVSSEQVDETEDYIYRSTSEMRTLLGNGKFDDLDLNDLAVARQPATCAYCNFHPLCIQQLDRAGRAEEAAVVQGRFHFE